MSIEELCCVANKGQAGKVVSQFSAICNAVSQSINQSINQSIYSPSMTTEQV